MCTKTGVILVYLPSYPPNLIQLKNSLRSWRFSLSKTGESMRKVLAKDSIYFFIGVSILYARVFWKIPGFWEFELRDWEIELLGRHNCPRTSLPFWLYNLVEAGEFSVHPSLPTGHCRSTNISHFQPHGNYNSPHTCAWMQPPGARLKTSLLT